jgi:mannose-6-phosphate isomerase
VFIAAGTVHALGAGLVIAEIQQASDTTFRLFDFNRVDAQGKPRQLHVAESLATIDYQRGPVDAVTPVATDQLGRERLVECDKFVLDRCTLTSQQTCGGDPRFHLLVCLEGRTTIEGEMLSIGECRLVPAAAGAVALVPEPRAVVLDIYLP